MRTSSAVLVALLAGLLPATQTSAVSSRIIFERMVPPAHDLGTARDVAIVEAATSDPQIETFVDQFVHHVNRSGMLTLRDMRSGSGPADAHLNVENFRCDTMVRETDGEVRDVDGNRVKQRVFEIDAGCGAHIAVLSRFLEPRSKYFVKGEANSGRLAEVTDEEREKVLRNAARYAAIVAADRITPRRVRESIELVPTAPAFAEGMDRIERGRDADARAIWERAMQTHPASAALRFNLGAVCEALGDRRAAEAHYKAARQLAPKDPRYASELELFALRKP
jgi:hypothetical protein